MSKSNNKSQAPKSNKTVKAEAQAIKANIDQEVKTMDKNPIIETYIDPKGNKHSLHVKHAVTLRYIGAFKPNSNYVRVTEYNTIIEDKHRVPHPALEGVFTWEPTPCPYYQLVFTDGKDKVVIPTSCTLETSNKTKTDEDGNILPPTKYNRAHMLMQKALKNENPKYSIGKAEDYTEARFLKHLEYLKSTGMLLAASVQQDDVWSAKNDKQTEAYKNFRYDLEYPDFTETKATETKDDTTLDSPEEPEFDC
jgi:hypothetical protein